MRYEDKLRQADREACAALVGLAATALVWALCGFGLAGCGITVFSMPLWIVAGCGGTFLFAVGVAVWMACFVMKDVGLDEGGGAGAGGSALDADDAASDAAASIDAVSDADAVRGAGGGRA